MTQDVAPPPKTMTQTPKQYHLYGTRVPTTRNTRTNYPETAEVRPPWDGKGEHTRFPIARLHYTKIRGEWSLFWRDRNLKFHAYDIAPTQTVQVLLDHIKDGGDPIFEG